MPTPGCVYGQFDPRSLTPTTPETEYRVRQLGWTREEFEGRSVLDIGCNGGALSVVAAQLGAASVQAVDPTQEFLDALGAVIAMHQLPIALRLGLLKDLDPAADAADIVLFMEVLHWAVDQGMPIPEIIRRLWAVTRRTLYIEFPWSVDEPSIRAQTKLTPETYSADQVFEELDRAFEDVRVVGFMRYFGLGGKAKRVLVRAAQPRPEHSLAGLLPQMASIGRLGERSSNYFAPLLTPKGMKLFKQISPHSSLSRLPFADADGLLRDIAAVEPACLVLPEELDGKYLIEHRGSRYMVLPYVKRLRVSFIDFSPVSLDHIFDSILKLRRDLRKVRLRDAAALAAADEMRRGDVLPVPANLARFADRSSAQELFWRLLDRGVEDYAAAATEICHGDLQEGNIVVGENGEPRVVDLDTLAFGTGFTDALCAMSWVAASENDFASILAELEREENSVCGEVDFAIAILMLSHWFAAFEGAQGPDVAAIAYRAERGLESLLKVAGARV